MKTCLFPAKLGLTTLAVAGMLLSTLPSVSFAGGWFLPTKSPAGEYHKYWAIGLSAPVLERSLDVRTMKDGTHIFGFQNGNGGGHIYIWDRSSSDYNSPAVASTDPSFKTYTTLDGQNLTFLNNVYGQLGELWSSSRTPAQSALMAKLWSAIAGMEGRG